MRGENSMVLGYRSSGANVASFLRDYIQRISMLLQLARIVFCWLYASTFYDAPLERMRFYQNDSLSQRKFEAHAFEFSVGE